jgi:hypothetical protein
METLDVDEMDDFSPEAIAEYLFTQNPQPPNSCKIITTQRDVDITFIFEILMTIFWEGIDILVDGLDTIKLEDITKEVIVGLNPWINSIGFNMYVKIVDYSDQKSYEEYYCKILTKHMHSTWFSVKGIETNYTFNLNGNFLEVNRQKTNLSELFAILKIGSNALLLSFDYLDDPAE